MEAYWAQNFYSKMKSFLLLLDKPNKLKKEIKFYFNRNFIYYELL